MQDKVLIVEDARSFALLLQSLLLEQYHYESDIAYCLAEAEVLLKENDGRYFSAIVDLSLPDAADGEAVDVVIAKKISTIVFTGTTNPAMKEDLWDRGIADYANKSGAHSIENVLWTINRVFLNANTEILVVDDSIVARKTLAKLLRPQRVKVHLAADGASALEILEANPNITVAVVDCCMEEMDGFELASRMRKERSRESLEIIGMSSAGTGALSAQFIKSGANDFLIKPFIQEEILCRVNRAAERVETFKKLEELNHVKNQLLGTAAHDIRGPVGAIKTAASYLLTRSPSEERTQKFLEMIERSSSDLIDLLSDLLDVSTIESGEIQLHLNPCNIDQLLEDRISLYESEASLKEISINLLIEDSVELSVDVIKMRQVIDNVITNGIKYTPVGGRVELVLEKDEAGVQIRISDSGSGVPICEQKDLFKPFTVLSSKTTAGEKATGLGLAIVKNIVVAHSGTVTYSDTGTGGACFTISLPNP